MGVAVNRPPPMAAQLVRALLDATARCHHTALCACQRGKYLRRAEYPASPRACGKGPELFVCDWTEDKLNAVQLINVAVARKERLLINQLTHNTS